MLAMMVFVTSPLNDLGDINGDKEAGRRTIPIVIGKENAVRLSILIAIGIGFSSWFLYLAVFSPIGNGEEDSYIYNRALILPLAVSLTSILTVFHLRNILTHLDDRNYVRDSVTRKSMPLHILLQISLIIGCILI
jgi:geranylgeranylglycerol-phosphate geranylgeranyltransferase